ncbi:HTH-type transcriptional repressor PurR [bioreactor metagenome]|uniref:HTH-type transcriptional repressor PurR n=1 Tax=bioreactor metagenome TaxID=1076179 RepID=A0A645CMZ1_9ZZZZ
MHHVLDKTESLKKTLTYEILSGYYTVGSKLPSERALSEKYNISRNTVRLTLEELETAGVIMRLPRSGAVITPAAPVILRDDASPEVGLSVAWILPPDQISNPVVQTIFAVFTNYCSPRVRVSVIFIDQLAQEEFNGFQFDMAILFSISDQTLRRKIKKRIPHLILLNAIDEEFDYIAPDNRLGGRMMAELLIRCGHRKIGGVSFDELSPGSDFKERLDGCFEVFQQAGIAFEPYKIQAALFYDCRYRRQMIAPAVETDFTALLAGCDAIAAELCTAAAARGKNIPADLSVIGFDDQFYASFMQPPLTTVKYPAEAIAIHLADVTEKLLKGETGRIQKLIAPTLIERQSVRSIIH